MKTLQKNSAKTLLILIILIGISFNVFGQEKKTGPCSWKSIGFMAYGTVYRPLTLLREIKLATSYFLPGLSDKKAVLNSYPLYDFVQKKKAGELWDALEMGKVGVSIPYRGDVLALNMMVFAGASVNVGPMFPKRSDVDPLCVDPTLFFGNSDAFIPARSAAKAEWQWPDKKAFEKWAAAQSKNDFKSVQFLSKEKELFGMKAMARFVTWDDTDKVPIAIRKDESRTNQK